MADEREVVDLTEIYGKPRLSDRLRGFALTAFTFVAITIPGTILGWVWFALAKFLSELLVEDDADRVGKLYDRIMGASALAFVVALILFPAMLFRELGSVVSLTLEALTDILVSIASISTLFSTLISSEYEVPEGAERWYSTYPVEETSLGNFSTLIVILGVVAATLFVVFIVAKGAQKLDDRAIVGAAKDLADRHDRLIDEWRRYTHDDIDLVERHTFLSDVEEPFVADLIEAMETAAGLRPGDEATCGSLTAYDLSLDAVEDAWDEALTRSEEIAESATSENDRKLLREAEGVWGEVSDIQASPQQRSRSAMKMGELMGRLGQRD